jgi:hypothetical protein
MNTKLILLILLTAVCAPRAVSQDTFPDGTPVSDWFRSGDTSGDPPPSVAAHVTLRRITLECRTAFHVEPSERYDLSDFTLENIDVRASLRPEIRAGHIRNFTQRNVVVNGKKLSDI